MLSTDREVDQAIDRLEQQKIEELGSYLTEKIGDKPEFLIVKIANEIRVKLKMSLGAALCFSFWLVDLQGICFSSVSERERILQLGRLIKISGGEKTLNYALAQTPQPRRDELKKIWEELANWKSRK